MAASVCNTAVLTSESIMFLQLIVHMTFSCTVSDDVARAVTVTYFKENMSRTVSGVHSCGNDHCLCQ